MPLNTLLTAEQYRYILEDARAKVLFVSAPLLAVAQQATAGLDLRMIAIGEPSGGLPRFDQFARGREERRAAGEDLAGRSRVLALLVGLDRHAEGCAPRACERDGDRETVRARRDGHPRV